MEGVERPRLTLAKPDRGRKGADVTILDERQATSNESDSDGVSDIDIQSLGDESTPHGRGQRPVKDNFTKVPNNVLTDASVSMQARVLYVLLRMHGREDASAYPAQHRLAKELGVTERTVRTHLQELQAAGLIYIGKQRGLNKTKRYELFNDVDRQRNVPLPEPPSGGSRLPPMEIAPSTGGSLLPTMGSDLRLFSGSELPVNTGSTLPVNTGSVLPPTKTRVTKTHMTQTPPSPPSGGDAVSPAAAGETHASTCACDVHPLEETMDTKSPAARRSEALDAYELDIPPEQARAQLDEMWRENKHRLDDQIKLADRRGNFEHADRLRNDLSAAEQQYIELLDLINAAQSREAVPV